MANEQIYGTDWSDTQNDAVVSAYFQMLNMELAGEPYQKVRFNELVVSQTGRTRGSVEFKFQNISAVLQKIGDPWILGYKPASNAQASIIDAIDRFKSDHGEYDIRNIDIVGIQEQTSLFLEKPPALSEERFQPRLAALVRKFDPAIRDAANRKLGRSGEELALNAEKSKLRAAGRTDLADKVDWISEKNDAAGYDILSFDLQGNERLLEVKTTRGYERTPFYLSENERRFSEERPEAFKLFRIYNFDREPKAFELTPPLEQFVQLQVANYRAHF